MRALVVFHDEGADHWLSRRLKEGFRHVFCVVEVGQYWIRVDGERGRPVVEVIAARDYDLVSFYRSEGYRVVETHRRDDTMRPLVLGNCVGVVKVMLGLRSWSVTPWQLYRRLVP